MARVVIAEKPSMGRAIAQALGLRGGGGQGFIAGKEGDEELIVTWAIGHLVELAPPEAYRPEWKAWRADRLPIVPPDGRFQLVVTPRSSGQFAVVAGLLGRKDVRQVVNACDAGREGELIFDLIMRHSGCTLPVVRLWTASLTDAAIRAAWRAMKPAAHYVPLRDAARSRQEADWLVGLNATRAQTIRARAGGEDTGVWSIGRVQTPTLALLVTRHQAIAAFVAETYFTIEGRFGAAHGELVASWFDRRNDKIVHRFRSRAAAEAVIARLAGAPAVVERIERKAVHTPPERLYDLTTLQREGNRRHGFSAQKTLELAQALYEKHKVLTYPRTSSRHLTQDVGATIPALVGQLAAHPGPLGALAQKLHARSPGLLGPRFVDDREVDDHHAIIPTGAPPSGLSADEAAIYALVVRRLLAAHEPDLVEDKTQVVVLVGDRDRFRASGVAVRSPGWTAVDPPQLKQKAESRLPLLADGEALTVLALTPKEGKTQPPRPYTEADLLLAMERAGAALDDAELRLAMKDSGLGTPATRASIIEALISRKYVARRQKLLEPTGKGIALIDSLATPGLRSPSLTGEWEAKLMRMQRGAVDRPAFMAQVVAFTREVVSSIASAPPPAHVPGLGRPRERNGPPCTGCKQATRTVYSAKQQRQLARCDACNLWLPA